ncbi:MAG: LysR family transcriptional regulator [Coriobacteriaceae bacterium]|jgi:hypothetical protein|nr:LysR family transcriptional regulator [Coriobacteriaceae bacterium]
MQTDDLRHFMTTFRQGGYTSAAKDSYITPQALCGAVKRLEKDIGVPLFTKVGRNIEPTEAGMIVFEKAVQILDGQDEMVRLARNTREQPQEDPHKEEASEPSCQNCPHSPLREKNLADIEITLRFGAEESHLPKLDAKFVEVVTASLQQPLSDVPLLLKGVNLCAVS